MHGTGARARLAAALIAIGAAAGVAAPGAGAQDGVVAGGAAIVEPTSLRSAGSGREVFPIKGRHDLGQTATNRFGGGRNHQGQDLFARCGTPLVAARDAKVTRATWHAAAGHYVVLTGRDREALVYMHLRDRPLVRVGDRVRAGELVGYVGDTGRATGCHLHIELWTAPGYYQGGSPIDPMPWLRSLDAKHGARRHAAR